MSGNFQNPTTCIRDLPEECLTNSTVTWQSLPENKNQNLINTILNKSINPVTVFNACEEWTTVKDNSHFVKKSIIKKFCAYAVSKGTKSGYLGGRFLYTTENYQFWFNFNLLLTGKSAVTHPSWSNRQFCDIAYFVLPTQNR